MTRDRSWPLWVIFCYSLAVLALLSIKPLWLDEVLELTGTTSASLHSLLEWIPVNPGASPLGYLTQRPFVLAGGPTRFWARLPSALFSIASCWVLLRLCWEMKIPRTVAAIAAGIFAVAPSQFRYALEGRPYSEALFFTVLSMYAAMKLAQRPTSARACLCVLAIAAGLYTQPYTILAVAGFGMWQAITNARRWFPACMAVSALLFLPWYLSFSKQWGTDIRASGYPQFHWTLGLAQDAFKGISGGSFLCSAALVALAIAGFLGSGALMAWRGALASGVLVAILGALAGDWIKSYFFASRQIMFALPALSILAAAGFWSALSRSKPFAVAGAAVLLIASIKNDATPLLNTTEDWAAAASVLDKVSSEGYCLQLAWSSGVGIDLYSVFVPKLKSRTCHPERRPSKIALVSHLYANPSEFQAAERALQAAGFSQEKILAAGGTTIALNVPNKRLN